MGLLPLCLCTSLTGLTLGADVARPQRKIRYLMSAAIRGADCQVMTAPNDAQSDENGKAAKPMDAAVRQALIEGHRDILAFLRWRLGNREEAQEVLQRFTVRALERASDLRDVQTVRRWLGFLGVGVGLVLFVLALRHLGTARTAAYFSLAPFMGALGVDKLTSERREDPSRARTASPWAISVCLQRHCQTS